MQYQDIVNPNFPMLTITTTVAAASSICLLLLGLLVFATMRRHHVQQAAPPIQNMDDQALKKAKLIMEAQHRAEIDEKNEVIKTLKKQLWKTQRQYGLLMDEKRSAFMLDRIITTDI